ncbi:hypothetical protein ACW73I_12930 [Methylomonas sp. MgM2]
MNIKNYRKETRRKSPSRRISDRRQHDHQFGSPGWIASVADPYAYVPNFDRRLGERRRSERRQPERRQNSCLERQVTSERTVRILLTKEERDLIEDLFLLNSLD